VNKRETVAASAAVCAGLIGAGRLIDRRHGGKPIATAGAVGLAAAYVAGTYLQNLPLFGAVARPLVGAESRDFALTFDDGPDPRHTAAISALLAERGHQGTFFVLGRAARRYPELIRQLAADGHEIACHGDDHRLLAFASPHTVRAQIEAWEDAVEAALGHAGARLVRTPHGVRSPWFGVVARNLGYAVCGWDGSVFDTAEPGSAEIVRRVVALLRPGVVVLLHDGDGSGQGGSRAQTVSALGPVLDAAEQRNLRSTALGTLVS
jgi:peptidoglycan-N-acetylglucosamine deacetylase